MKTRTINEMRAYCEEATEGPWEHSVYWSGATEGSEAHARRKGEKPHAEIERDGKKILYWKRALTEKLDEDDEFYNHSQIHQAKKPTLVVGTYTYDHGGVPQKEDADFIANARTDMPLLLEFVEKYCSIELFEKFCAEQVKLNKEKL